MKKSIKTLFGVVLIAALALAACPNGDEDNASKTKVTMEKSIEMEVGDDMLIEAKTVPANTPLSWKSSDDTVVEVYQGGVVYAVKEGSATITATAPDGGSGKCTIKVVPSTKFEISDIVMEKGQGFVGEISDDGVISFTAGAVQYKFPSDIDLSEYAYFIVMFDLISASGNVSGVKCIQYGTADTAYDGAMSEKNGYGGELDVNIQPWLSNAENMGILFPISGGGNKGGFALKWGGQSGTAIEFRVTSITLVQLPEYTVTFNLNGGNGTVPTTGVKVYKGFTIGTANFPQNPTKTNYTFIGWKNEAGDTVTATTKITDDWVLTAQWVLTSEATPVVKDAPANGTLFSAVGSYAAGATAGQTFTYNGNAYWIVANAHSGNYNWTAPIAPFDSTASSTFTEIQTAQSSYGGTNQGYTRIAFDVGTITAEPGVTNWDNYSKVTITYDMVSVGGNGTSVQFRNSSIADSGTEIISTQGTTLTAGTGKTLTFDASLLKNTASNRNGWIGIVKNGNGALLLRITQVKLHYID